MRRVYTALAVIRFFILFFFFGYICLPLDCVLIATLYVSAVNPATSELLSTPEESPRKMSRKIAVILIAIGSILLVLLIISTIYLIIRRKQRLAMETILKNRVTFTSNNYAAPPFVKFSNNDDGTHPHEVQRQNSGNSIIQGNSISVSFPGTGGFSNPGFHGSSDELNLNLQHVLYSGSLPRSRSNILEIFGQNIPDSAFDEYTQENSPSRDGDFVNPSSFTETENTQQESIPEESGSVQSKSSTLQSVGYLSPELRIRSASDAAAIESINMQGLTNPMFDSGMGSSENGRPLTYAYIEGEEDSNYGSASSDDYASISNYTQKLEGFDVGESNDYDSVGEEVNQNWHLTTEAKDLYANAAVENAASAAPEHPIKSVYLHTPSQSIESHPQTLSHQDSTLSIVREENNEVYEAQNDYNYVAEDAPRVTSQQEYDYVGSYDDSQNDRDEQEQCYYENTNSLKKGGIKTQEITASGDYDYPYDERTVHASNTESVPRTPPEYNYVWDMGEPSNYYDDARSLDLTPDSLDPDYEYVSQSGSPSHNSSGNNFHPPLHERSFGNANSIEFLDDPTTYEDDATFFKEKSDRGSTGLDSSHEQTDEMTDQPCYEYVRNSTVSTAPAPSEQTSDLSQDPDDPPYYDSVRASTFSSGSDKSKQCESSSQNLTVPSGNENRFSIVSYESIGSAIVPPEFADHIYDEIHRKTLLELSHEVQNGSNQRNSNCSNSSNPTDTDEHYDEIQRQSMMIDSDLEKHRISQSSNISHSTSRGEYESDYETFNEAKAKVHQSCENISQDLNNQRISQSSNISFSISNGEYESDYEAFSEAIAKVHQKSCENIPQLPSNEENNETIHTISNSTENIYTNEPLYDDVCPIEPGEKVKRLSSFISSLPPPLPLKSFSAVRRQTDSDSDDENYMDMSHDTSHDRSCDMTDEPIEDYSPMSPGPDGLEFQRNPDSMFPEDVTAF